MRPVLALALASCAAQTLPPPVAPTGRTLKGDVGVATLEDWRQHDRHVDVGAPMSISTSGFNSGEREASLARILADHRRVYATVCPVFRSETPRVTLEADLPARFRQHLAEFMAHVLATNEVVFVSCVRISVRIEAS